MYFCILIWTKILICDFFFSSRRRHTRWNCDWSSDVCSSDLLSGGRFRLGLGVSGPQVVEGWHGQPFGKPLAKTREYVEIIRAILRREKPVEFRGEYYQIPYAGPNATGLGKPLRSILHGRADLPIYLAAVGPKNVALAAEIADGWIPIFFSPHRMKVFGEGLDEGF